MGGVRLAAEDVRKRFGPTPALRGVSLTLGAGEVHALLGGNGSGKSTFIKILAGVERADAGWLVVGERSLDARKVSPTDAHECGLRFIHQQPATFAPMTVAENLVAGVGFPRRRSGAIDWRATRRRAAELLERFEIDASPNDCVGDLRPVTRQMVAIARALQGREDARGGVLVLDEPTASLPAEEVGTLHDALKRYSAAGQAVLYVTHRLEELPGFAQRATVLRDGQVAGRLEEAELDHDRLVELISGDARPARVSVKPARRDAVRRPGSRDRLVVEGLSGGRISSASFTLGAGEIVGLAGLVGSGRTSLLELLFGVRPPADGTIRLDGALLEWRGGRPHPGVAYLPEDRARDAAFLPLSVAENIMAASTARHWRHGRLRHRAEAADARAVMNAHGIRAGSETAPLQTLSGGNQQKAMLARWMIREPSVLLLEEPTQGVDVAARAAIHDQIRGAAAAGTVVLVASSDADELASLCDRAIVLIAGRTTCEVPGSELTAQRLERLPYGLTSADV